jgi:hypothetical protein
VGVVGQGDEVVRFTATSIEVDIDGLSDFRTFLTSEVDANLRPGSDDVICDHVMGVRFGHRNPGYSMGQATKSYQTALENSISNLDEYVRTGRTLTQLIRIVAGTYRAADLTSAGSGHDLNTALSDAMVLMRTPDSETDRETNRATGSPADHAAEHLANRLAMSTNGVPQQKPAR